MLLSRKYKLTPPCLLSDEISFNFSYRSVLSQIIPPHTKAYHRPLPRIHIQSCSIYFFSISPCSDFLDISLTFCVYLSQSRI